MLAIDHVRNVTNGAIVSSQRAGSIAEVLALLRRRGAKQYVGEPVCHREHALLCATLAHAAGAAAPLVAACLMHDIGHLLADAPADEVNEGDAAATPTLAGVDDRHEVTGAVWLGELFPPAVLQPIRWHVAAKRYLAATEPGYLATLSEDSVRSLAAAHAAADPAARGQIELVFDALTTYGGGIGEVLGVSLFMALALGLLAIGALRRGGLPTWVAAFGLVAALSLGALTLPVFGAPDLMPVAAAVSLLSLWMISVGVRCVWGGPLK